MKIFFIILIAPWIIGIILYLANKKEVDRIADKDKRRYRRVIKKRPTGMPWMPYTNVNEYIEY
jgi:archaellum component FlaF (FlaF/FlaG flagellin family)